MFMCMMLMMEVRVLGWVGVRLTWRDLFCAEEGKRRKEFAKEGRKEAIYR